MKILSQLFDIFSSVRLAVALLLSLAVILAYGTVYESNHGTPDAQRVVYKSIYLSILMFLLILNLACAAIDRLPWKKHHIGFVTTHMGIITLIYGSFLTQQRGLDGSLALSVQQESNIFILPETDLQAFQSFDGRPFSILFQKAVDFDARPPQKHDYSFDLVDDDKLKIINYSSKAVRDVNVRAAKSKKAEAALKFVLYNDRVNVSEWLSYDNRLPPFHDLGPATVSFIKGSPPEPSQPKNQLVFYKMPESQKLYYAVFSSRGLKPVSKGEVKPGTNYPTGWMNLQFQVSQYFPNADVESKFVPVEKPDKNTTQAIEVAVGENRRWIELGMPREVKGPRSTYFVNYMARRHELGFRIKLEKFKISHYQGSDMPMDYQSTVSVDSQGPIVISMNEPLKYKGFKLFQASYELNENGEPVTSIFSVNYDPGREVKYAGSIGIVLGIVFMFYFKPRWSRVKRVKA